MAAPTRVSTGTTIAATHINQYADRVNRQSTQTEVGSYWFQQGTFASNATCGVWIVTTSRDATPSGVVIDTSITAATGYNAPIVQTITSSGFFVSATGTGISNTSRVGGIWTATY